VYLPNISTYLVDYINIGTLNKMRDLSNELRKIANDHWRDLQSQVEEKELKRMNAFGDAPQSKEEESEDEMTPEELAELAASEEEDKKGFDPEIEKLISEGKLEAKEIGGVRSIVIPPGDAGKKVLDMLFGYFDKE